LGASASGWGAEKPVLAPAAAASGEPASAFSSSGNINTSKGVSGYLNIGKCF
jgi:hypothetical protein